MAKKKFRAEDIINKLREAKVLTSQGKTVSLNDLNKIRMDFLENIRRSAN